MKKDQIYTHNKTKGEYIFKGISNPLETSYISTNSEVELQVVGKAIREDTLTELSLYDIFISGEKSGLYFSKSDIPFVIYQSKSDNKVWARRVDLFFGNTINNGISEKRFSSGDDDSFSNFGNNLDMLLKKWN